MAETCAAARPGACTRRHASCRAARNAKRSQAAPTDRWANLFWNCSRDQHRALWTIPCIHAWAWPCASGGGAPAATAHTSRSSEAVRGVGAKAPMTRLASLRRVQQAALLGQSPGSSGHIRPDSHACLNVWRFEVRQQLAWPPSVRK
eukprot:351697-Chlamydomonas_euryale.AAC.12